jgi:hypothetical protein
MMYDIPQAQLPIIECPVGTIPILRNKRGDHMEVQNIDEVISRDEQQEVNIIPKTEICVGAILLSL